VGYSLAEAVHASRITIENEYTSPAVGSNPGSLLKYSGAVKRAEGEIMVFFDKWPDGSASPSP
jgi:hypothetical protein